MTVTVTEEDGRHRSAVPYEGSFLPCCEAGHPDEAEAALHAFRLVQAMERKTDGGNP